MSRSSRRTFVAGTAAIPFWLWFEQYAKASPPFVRHEANTPQGKLMLQSYAKGVDQMMNHIAAGEPTNWVFQWYTHFVKGSTTKSAELARIYPTPSPNQTLATAMWDTCQAHSPGQNEDFFLPWHRMFVFHFERMIRKFSGDESFALPYWNYSTPNPSLHGVIPAEFRVSRSVLFVDKRNQPPQPNVNAGQPIDKGQPGNPLGLGCLGQCTYESQGAVPGFCMDTDNTVHGSVHVLVGNTQNMGQIPWAADDPVFWMHHCNIDRLWASWNRGGRTNPTAPAFLSQTFTFADENNYKVVMRIGDVLDFAKLGYTYDAFEKVPPCKKTAEAVRASVANLVQRATVPATQVTLDRVPVSVTLESPETGAVPLTQSVAALTPERSLFVVARDLRADVSPGVLYHVYFDLPPGTPPAQAASYYVGALNFFGAVHHTEEGAASSGTVPSKFFSFDVTEVAKTLQAAGKLSAKPSLTIVPSGEPESEAKPVLGSITLVEQ
ncbi:MAG: tyrosinase family protein [Candidatus Acidiferrum sp.]|jgi:tyrosinase